MPFSYEDKPNRGLRIFLIGGAGLLGVFTMVVEQHVFIMGMSIVPIALVAEGFLIPINPCFRVAGKPGRTPSLSGAHWLQRLVDEADGCADDNPLDEVGDALVER